MTCKRRWRYWVFLLGMIVCLEGCQYSFLPNLYPEEGTFTENVLPEEVTSEEMVSSNEIYVHICGAVKHPGLYSFREGDRIDAAIQAAGGFTKKAEQKSVNLAELLADGMQIVVREKVSESATESKDERVNLNQADLTALMSLSGIGESKAQAILAYRESHGSFTSTEELKNVQGIGDGIYERIKDAVMVE